MKIIIAASGTGGHLIPALTIAKGFNEHNVVFIGSGRPLEDEIIKGYKKYNIKVVGVKNRGIKGKMQFLFLLPYAVFQVIKILIKEKPDYILGVGGYVSVLPVFLGKLFKIRTGIYELEKHFGLANKFLAKITNDIFSAFEIQNTKYVGICMRKEILKVPKLNSNKVKKILVFGGSQGSRILDEVILELSDYFKDNNLELWHQCRAESTEWLKVGYAAKGLNVKVESFVSKPEVAYEWADLIIARSGVGTVNEIKVVGRPAIFIPLSFASEQINNAENMQKLGLAKVVIENSNLKENLVKELESRDEFMNSFKLIKIENNQFNAVDKIVKNILV